jgi:hypothetical protein
MSGLPRDLRDASGHALGISRLVRAGRDLPIPASDA